PGTKVTERSFRTGGATERRTGVVAFRGCVRGYFVGPEFPELHPRAGCVRRSRLRQGGRHGDCRPPAQSYGGQAGVDPIEEGAPTLPKISRRPESASIVARQAPPGRTSIEIVSSGTLLSGPPNQSANASGRVHSSQTRSRVASKT